MNEDFLTLNHLRTLRVRRGLPQWKASLAIGISESRLCVLEQGAPPRKTDIEKLTGFYGVKQKEIWPGMGE